jgi:hypothetical protein
MTLAIAAWTPRGAFLATTAGSGNAGPEGLKGVPGKAGILTISYSAYSKVDFHEIVNQGIDNRRSPSRILRDIERAHEDLGDPTWNSGQVAVITADGIDTHTGPNCLEFKDSRQRGNVAFCANFASSEDVLDMLEEGYDLEPDTPIANRMVNALDFAVARGGDVRIERSAGMLFVPADTNRPMLARYVNYVRHHPVLALENRNWLPVDHHGNAPSNAQTPVAHLDRLVVSNHYDEAERFFQELYKTYGTKMPFFDAATLDMAIVYANTNRIEECNRAMAYLDAYYPDRVEAGVRLGLLDEKTRRPTARTAAPSVPAHRPYLAADMYIPPEDLRGADATTLKLERSTLGLS